MVLFTPGVMSLRSSISLSVFVHALLFLACFALLSQRTGQVRTTHTTWIEIEPLHQARIPLENPKIHKQIVQTDEGHDAKPVPNAYLGAKDQQVDRQTVSKDHTTAMGQARQRPQVAKNATETNDVKNVTEKNKATPRIEALSKLG